MSPFVATFLLIVAVLGLAVYFERSRPMEDGGPKPWHAEFKEPATGVWMRIHGTQIWALSDSGSVYAGGPWTDVLAALRATQFNPAFLSQYGLKSEDVVVPGWSTLRGEWGRMGACNLMNAAHLFDFWQETDISQLEYR